MHAKLLSPLFTLKTPLKQAKKNYQNNTLHYMTYGNYLK
ncbi:hypothetical protein GJA_1418 [Janthinobacterium agaricidamnosum NBRC 102515 = DSM 9628]|uniref:Uncharacterized protein n=1 Tax=Janthinobacterium agaricidamnosum NBRC 102515 = DSM 9628 TaxID=1349767 RepID=W0V2G5_9BURK|nr:hypothetical protein GJA_1418 [Janthinobacterium agaricidamnosum NBRC 102515 = DSM 9628]